MKVFKKSGPVLKIIFRDIFLVYFFSYIIFLFFEILSPGFVSDFFNLNLLLIICAFAAIISVIINN